MGGCRPRGRVCEVAWIVNEPDPARLPALERLPDQALSDLSLDLVLFGEEQREQLLVEDRAIASILVARVEITDDAQLRAGGPNPERAERPGAELCVRAV